MEAAFYTPTQLTEEQAREHDRVLGALADATRVLADAQLRTEVDLAEAEAVTADLCALTRRLEERSRPGSLGAEIGPDGHSVRNHGNPVTGLRNPFACVNQGNRRVDEGRHVHFDVELGALHEGPPGLVHGGVSALVLDQVLGEAAAVGGGPGMTGRLTLRYRRPTPLGPLSMEGWLVSTDGRKSEIRAQIRDPEGNVTVEADALFILPKWATDHPAWRARNRNFE